MTNVLVGDLRARLLEIEGEQAGIDEQRKRLDAQASRLVQECEHISALIALYEPASDGPDGMLAEYRKQVAARAEARAESNPQPPRRRAFAKVPGGPTERILEILQQTPGLTYSQVVNRVIETQPQTTAEKPGRSIGSSLQTLVKRGKVQRHEGKHYVAQQTAAI